MRAVNFLISILFISLSSDLIAQDTVRMSVSDVEQANNDVSSSINKTLLAFKGKKGLTLMLEKGKYHIWQKNAIKRDYSISNTNFINPRNCAILVRKMNNVTIDFGGSEFIFHGKLQPLTIDSCENIVVKNVSLDWEIPFGAEAEIAEVTPSYFDLKFDKKKFPYTIDNGKLFFIDEDWKNFWGGVKWNDPMQFDKETLSVTPNTDDDLLGNNWEKKYTAKELENGLVRIYYENTKLLKKGSIFVLRHGLRDHAGSFITDSKNVTLENINMYSNLGLSYLAQYSENITYNNVNCLAAPCRIIISGHDDGLHFSNCKGQITVTGCTMKGLMDDSFNVHGTYVVVTEKTSPNTLICKFPHFQSVGMLWARPNESIAFIDGENMKNYGLGKVVSLKSLTPETFEISFKEAIPTEIDKGDALENITWEPDVTIRNCYFGNHRARGVLISSGGKIVIDGNTFESSGSAIVFPGDIKSYFENGPIKDAVISNNHFKNCLTSSYMTCEAVISISLEVPKYEINNPPIHRNISIHNNTFELFDFPALYALSVDGISFSNNTLNFSNKYKPWHPRKATLTFDACRNIEVIENVVSKEVLGKNIKLIKTDSTELIFNKNQGFIIEN